ncbi:hypothetical protein [Stutzerimonas stutzeri]|uniref:hypothetical protein n=1 Tax=Stutzerimonas stutzeri TaxID=316 RepID=UPI000AB69DEC|nr:hypothetical protein [Stutzerimonas stutzeri]
MAKHKSPQEERSVISGQPTKRPYGVKVKIHLMTAGAIGVEEVCVSLHSGAFLAITPANKAPWEGGKKFLVTLEGFPTAASAESAGRRLVQALFWMAVSTDVPLRLEYLSYEPAAVFERNRSSGMTCEAYAESGRSPNIVLGELQDAYTQLKEPDEKLLLSMEIFCSARLESSQRAVFLALVSALEPLAQEAPLGDSVDAFVTQCASLLKDFHVIPSDIRNSLNGRLLQLRQESIRQALLRLTREALPDQPEASKIVDDAYALRSQIIHSGKPADLDIDLESEARVISTVIRNIYSSILKRKPVH